MNLLAHSLLGFGDEELIAGQICGDLVRGTLLTQFPRGIETGIRLHRHLDAFTDSNQDLKSARLQMHGVPLRFTGIVVDVLFDHFMAMHWSRLGDGTLAEHASYVHHALVQHHRFLPARLRHFMPVLHSERILERNVELASIEQTLARLSRRSVHFAPLAMDVARLGSLSEQLQEVFESFYPESRAAARTYVEASLGRSGTALREQDHPEQVQ